MNNKFEVTFLGTNGSCSYNNGNRGKYGINTPCVAVRAGDDTIIFDAGSGICGFGNLKDYDADLLHIFFSHYHVDHINGLLFFSPFFDKQKTVKLYGPNTEDTLFNTLDGFLSPPLHPVGIESFGANCAFHSIAYGCTVAISESTAVKTTSLSHPGGSVGYRVEHGGKTLCYCTDIELAHHQNDHALLSFTQNADLLILDSFIHNNKSLPGWGHSNWHEVALWAKRTGAKKLALFHYGFAITDDDIDAMEAKAKEVFPDTFAAADGMRVEL